MHASRQAVTNACLAISILHSKFVPVLLLYYPAAFREGSSLLLKVAIEYHL